MDLSDIQIIRTIIRSGSLSEASTILNQSQPTLSRKLSRLEDRLQTQLFHRSPKGLVPTEIANYIISKAEPIDNQLKAIERHVELTTQLETGTLRVGVGPIIEQILIPEILIRFFETTGDVRITVITEDDANLIRLFKASAVDVIIGPFLSEEWDDKSVLAHPMIKDKIVAVARREHPIFDHANITEDIIQRFSWAVPKTQGSARQAPGAKPLQNLKILADNYDLLKRLTLSLDTICAGPRAIFKEEIEDGRLKEVDFDTGFVWESSLLVRPETLSTPLANCLVSICMDVADDLDTQTVRA